MQPPIGALAAMRQSNAIAAHADSGRSWMLPEAKSDTLLYVSKLTRVIIYLFRSDKIVGKLSGFDHASGLCSDQNGNVWVTDYRKSQITEYAHAGTKPIAQLSDENEPVGCAVDPRSGDLAVANYAGNVSVYPNASGNPVIYTARDFFNMQFCSYDGSGNLFVDGYRKHGVFEHDGILKLSYGGTQLERYNLLGKRKSLHSAGGIQWDGKDLVVGYAGKYRNVLYRVADLGTIGKITRRVTLTVPGGGFIPGDYPFLVHRSEIVAPYEVYPNRYYIALWPYPGGGTAKKDFQVHGKSFTAGLTISVAPK